MPIALLWFGHVSEFGVDLEDVISQPGLHAGLQDREEFAFVSATSEIAFEPLHAFQE